MSSSGTMTRMADHSAKQCNPELARFSATQAAPGDLTSRQGRVCAPVDMAFLQFPEIVSQSQPSPAPGRDEPPHHRPVAVCRVMTPRFDTRDGLSVFLRCRKTAQSTVLNRSWTGQLSSVPPRNEMCVSAWDQTGINSTLRRAARARDRRSPGSEVMS